MGPASKKKKAAGGAVKGMSGLLDKWAAVRKQVVSRAVLVVQYARSLCSVYSAAYRILSVIAGQGSTLLLTHVFPLGSGAYGHTQRQALDA